MWSRSRAVVLSIGILSAAAIGVAVEARAAKGASTLPPIKLAPDNAMPECATPGRLMAFLRARNASLDKRFSSIATEYARHGQAMQIRWDFAFFQMMLETGNLSFRSNGRAGDVRMSQNNFAGIGATGGGVHGESFPDVSTGVRAHIEHLRLYAADPVDNPVAERTRKVREWGVLDSWQKKLKEPVTFRELAKRWAANSSYANDIQSVADAFFNDHCGKPDPEPNLAASAAPPVATAAAEVENEDRPSGKTLARQAAERGRREGQRRSALGGPLSAAQPAATTPGKTEAAPAEPAESEAAPKKAIATPALTLINPQPHGQPADKPAVQQGTSVVPPTKPGLPAGAATSKCRVWTASYGGQRALIIRSSSDQTTNYTVLDVNEGSEKREAEAYIKAYAKNGELIGEFQSSNAALDKAFELCPEG